MKTRLVPKEFAVTNDADEELCRVTQHTYETHAEFRIRANHLRSLLDNAMEGSQTLHAYMHAYPNTTVSQTAERLLSKHAIYDNALPQSWVDMMADRGMDVRGHFVWYYPPNDMHGVPFPITYEGILMLTKLARSV